MLLADGCVIFFICMATNCKVNSLLFVHLTESAIQPLILNVVQLAPEVRNQHAVGAPETLKESGLFLQKPLSAVDSQEQRQPTQTTERGEQEVTHSQIVNTLNGLEVSEFMAFLPSLKQHFIQQIASFEGGRIRKFSSHGQKITNDPEVLDMVSGTHIDFQSIPVRTSPKISSKFSPQECTTIQNEISNLLSKSVIVETHHDPVEFISPIFVRPKKDGTTRMILNLQALNEHVVYIHFKMDTLKDAISLINLIALWHLLFLKMPITSPCPLLKLIKSI